MEKGQRYIKVIPVITVPFPYGQDIMMFVIFGKGQRYIKVIPVITVLFPYVQDIMMFVIFGKRSTLYKSDSQ